MCLLIKHFVNIYFRIWIFCILKYRIFQPSEFIFTQFIFLKFIICRRLFANFCLKTKTEKIKSLFKSYLSEKNSAQKMIQKAIFQKRINEPTKTKIHHDTHTQYQQNNVWPFKDISNESKIPQKLSVSPDYKHLFEVQRQKTQKLCNKIAQLQQIIRNIENEQISLKQQISDRREYNFFDFHSVKKEVTQTAFFQEIRSFKSNLPNSMKAIQFQQLDNFQSVNFMTDENIMSKNELCQQQRPENLIQIQLNNENYQSFHNNDQKFIGNSAVTLKLINDESLIDCMAIYGLSQEAKLNEDQDEYLYEGQLKFCSKTPHQIIKHSSKLVFPQKINREQIKVLTDEQAVQTAVSLVNQTLKQFDFKAFTLIFEPATMQEEQSEEEIFTESIQRQTKVIDLVNKERRFYAICLAFQDFDLVDSAQNNRFADLSFQNSLQQDIFKQNIQEILKEERESKEPVQISYNKQLICPPDGQKSYKIRVTRKIIAFFSKFPFLPFFQSLLINFLKQSFQSRKQSMKKNLSELKNFDHTKTIQFLKIFYSNLNSQFKVGKKFEGKINQIFEIKLMSLHLSRYQTLSLELSKSLLRNYHSQIWAYPVLRLFTLDTFLDIFTLMMLEEKMIFVCENQHILTSAIFLYTKVFMKPFNYPYPVVSIIPNEYDYFNAPFPIVYGCLNSKSNLVRQKIPKIYKNVYVILSPSGVQIHCHKNLSKVLSHKSPKLRDKLMPSFIKVQQHKKQCEALKPLSYKKNSGLSSFLGFKLDNSISQTQKKEKFNFSNNRQLSHQIIQKVFQYLNGIKEKLPSKKQVSLIKQTIQAQVKQKNTDKQQVFFDIDKETYERVKTNLLRKTADPFVQKFLETQIVGMEILG